MFQLTHLVGFGAGGVVHPNDPTGVDVMPTFTAATTGGMTMSASSEYSAFFPAWKAGDDSVTAAVNTWYSQNSLPQWLAVDLGTLYYIDTYTITSGVSGDEDNVPYDFTLEGSLDGSTWDTIDTRTAQSFGVTEKKTYTIAAPGEYRHYRLNVEHLNTASQVVVVGELELIYVG